MQYENTRRPCNTSCGLVALLGGAHATKHGQAAGEQDEGHDRNVGDAMEWPGPVRGCIAEKSVSNQTTGESGGVSDDEKPHRHFFCRDRESWRGH